MQGAASLVDELETRCGHLQVNVQVGVEAAWLCSIMATTSLTMSWYLSRGGRGGGVGQDGWAKVKWCYLWRGKSDGKHKG